MVAHERISCSSTRDKVLQDLGAAPIGAVTSYNSGDTRSAPMEVNLIKGKSKAQERTATKAKERASPILSRARAKANSLTREKAREALERAMVTIQRVDRNFVFWKS